MNHFRIFLNCGSVADVFAHEYIKDNSNFKFLEELNDKQALVIAEFVCTAVAGIMVVRDNED